MLIPQEYLFVLPWLLVGNEIFLGAVVGRVRRG